MSWWKKLFCGATPQSVALSTSDEPAVTPVSPPKSSPVSAPGVDSYNQGATLFVKETSFEFCPILAGTFRMESNEVEIDEDFYLGKYPVTQKQWEAVMGNNPSLIRGGSLPVETVSWYDAQAFVEKLNTLSGKMNYRLPTEAEWEYACRAGTTSEYYFGDDASQLGEYAWFEGNSDYTTHPVGQKKPNEWGLYDMTGNVWEWTDSWYDDTFSNRVLRGGSWLSDAEYCRSAFRNGNTPGRRYDSVGFRLVFVP